jgi:hypothetical protein
MYYCNDCGQCKYIDDTNFIEYADVSGTETRYVNCENGDVEDYGDSDISGTGDSATHCPHCDSEDLDFEWEGEEEEAFAQRATHETRLKVERERLKKEQLIRSVKDSEWDLDSN